MNGGREKGDVEAVTEMKRKEERVMHANAEVCGPRYVRCFAGFVEAGKASGLDGSCMDGAIEGIMCFPLF